MCVCVPVSVHDRYNHLFGRKDKVRLHITLFFSETIKLRISPVLLFSWISDIALLNLIVTFVF